MRKLRDSSNSFVSVNFDFMLVVIMLKILAFILLIEFSLTFRLKRQISFGGDSSKESHKNLSNNVPNKIKPIIPSKSKQSSNGISFGGKTAANNNFEDFNLNDILQLETPAPELSARFGFGSVSSRIGESCVTPLGEQGSCQFIVADQCRPVLNRILKYGVTQVKYT